MNNQGLDLMSNKIIKAFIAASQVPTKSREKRDALGRMIWKFLRKL